MNQRVNFRRQQRHWRTVPYGIVYILNNSIQNRFSKIGYSANPNGAEQRCESYARQHGMDGWAVYAVFPTSYPIRVEASIHARLQERRVRLVSFAQEVFDIRPDEAKQLVAEEVAREQQRIGPERAPPELPSVPARTQERQSNETGVVGLTQVPKFPVADTSSILSQDGERPSVFGWLRRIFSGRYVPEWRLKGGEQAVAQALTPVGSIAAPAAPGPAALLGSLPPSGATSPIPSLSQPATSPAASASPASSQASSSRPAPLSVEDHWRAYRQALLTTAQDIRARQAALTTAQDLKAETRWPPESSLAATIGASESLPPTSPSRPSGPAFSPAAASLSEARRAHLYDMAILSVAEDLRARNKRLKTLNALIDPPTLADTAEELQKFLVRWSGTPEAQDPVMTYEMDRMRKELARREQEGEVP